MADRCLSSFFVCSKVKELTEGVFQSIWKSYKTFVASGKVIQHTATDYTELKVDEDNTLLLTAYCKNRPARINRAESWEITVEKQKQILQIQFAKSQQRFEVITVNHTDMVLIDLQSQDKLFFAKSDAWESLIERGSGGYQG